VSVVVPCRNERDFIDAFIADLLAQREVDGGIEILVADGSSDDGTRERLQRRVEVTRSLRCINNPKKIVSSGLNCAVLAAKGDIVVRMDVHTRYATDYIYQCVGVLEETGADNVGGPWCAKGDGFMGRAISLAFNSAFAVGAARSRNLSFEGLVDTVYLGCWRRARLIELGLFDEELVRNQDDELNLRIRRAGGRIWQSPRIRSEYSPRSSLSGLAKQYMQYGYWKIRVIQKHRLPASVRHVIPGAFVASVIGSIVLAILNPKLTIVGLSIIVPYIAANLAASVATCGRRARLRYLPVMPLVFATFHFAYGCGFLGGVWNFVIRRTRAHGTFEKLTR
jgi:glycosyltransferase involved in cell wall biosynthesis